MKKRLVFGNWKSNKTVSEARVWLSQVQSLHALSSDKTVVLFPSFTLLPFLKEAIAREGIPVQLGAQDISSFPKGAYTGEVNGEQIREFADYVLIGHSERREHLKEEDETLQKKVDMAQLAGLQVVYCIRDSDSLVPIGVKIVAYEPLSAIGTGHPDSPGSAELVAKTIKEKYEFVESVIYGGSVNGENVASFTARPSIDGVLPGTASLDSNAFLQIVQHA